MKTLKINIPDGYEIDKKNSTFEKIVFKPLEKNNYPKTWEDCIKKLNDKVKKFYWISGLSDILDGKCPILRLTKDHYNLLTSKKDAEKFLILQKLYTCRRAYIENWEPDWGNTKPVKYVITVENNILQISSYCNYSRSFSFPTLEMAKKFLKNFKSDLEFVKNLL